MMSPWPAPLSWHRWQDPRLQDPPIATKIHEHPYGYSHEAEMKKFRMGSYVVLHVTGAGEQSGDWLMGWADTLLITCECQMTAIAIDLKEIK